MFVLELTFSKIPDSFSSRSGFFYTLKCEEPLLLRGDCVRCTPKNAVWRAVTLATIGSRFLATFSNICEGFYLNLYGIEFVYFKKRTYHMHMVRINRKVFS